MGIIKSAGMFIKNIDGRYLMGHPTHHNKDVWSMCKGSIEKDETPLAAAIRETIEECGLDVEKTEGEILYINEITYKISKGYKNLKIFLFKSSVDLNNFPFICNSFFERNGNLFPEMDKFKLMELSEIENRGMGFVKEFFKQNRNNL